MTIRQQQKSQTRLMALEGLRGVAAVMVVIYHLTLLFHSSLVLGGTNMVYGMPWGSFLSGNFAVAIFFVLSGFVLTVGFFKSKDEGIIRKLALKRYIRLALPATVSILVGCAVTCFPILKQWAAMSGELQYQPNFFVALYDGLVGIFAGQSSWTYNHPTWTMFWEFLGSFIVFASCWLLGKSTKRYWLYIFLVLVLFQTWLLGFAIGMILADLYVNRPKVFTGHRLGLLALFLGIYLGGYPVGEVSNTLYRVFNLPGLPSQQIYLTIGGGLVLFAVLSMSSLQRLFSLRPLATLGKYTFSLYLIHLPILDTVCTGVFVALSGAGYDYNNSMTMAILIFTAVAIPIVWLFERYIDKPAIRLSSIVASILAR